VQQAGDDDQFLTRNLNINVFEIVFPRTFNNDFFTHKVGLLYRKTEENSSLYRVGCRITLQALLLKTDAKLQFLTILKVHNSDTKHNLFKTLLTSWQLGV
jgi:hypothetical protein